MKAIFRAVGFGLGLFACTPAFAQMDTETTPAQILLYKSLMKVNGLDDLIDDALSAKESETHALLLQRAKKTAFTPQEDARYGQIAETVLSQTEIRLTDVIAKTQSRNLSADDLRVLIHAYSLPIAQIYFKAKAANPPEKLAKAQAFMVSAVVRIVNTLKNPAYISPLDVAPTDPRILEAEVLYKVDGTADLIRRTVDRTHMPMVLGQLQNYVDVTTLSDSDKIRLAAVAKAAQTELDDRIIELNAESVAKVLTVADIKALTVAFDTAAQRKVTEMRLTDDGSMDRVAGEALDMAQANIVSQFEAAH